MTSAFRARAIACNGPPLSSGYLLQRHDRTDNVDMAKRVVLSEVLDKHQMSCPRCACPEAVVLLNPNFEVYWQCVDCEHTWAASEEESSMMLNFVPKTIH